MNETKKSAGRIHFNETAEVARHAGVFADQVVFRAPISGVSATFQKSGESAEINAKIAAAVLKAFPDALYIAPILHTDHAGDAVEFSRFL